ncbi:MAG: family 43 glycosylhydrolase [Phycisphaerae bacterium]|nr:family 43 glycosylhydrolase [Phycisphaerae bacterium]
MPIPNPQLVPPATSAPAIVAPQLPSASGSRWIEPGAVWPDNRSQPIQAHGGGLLKVGDLFYWFGEDRTQSIEQGHRCVACYSSPDLLNWTFRKQVVNTAMPENLGDRWELERPKVYFNQKTNKFVMYAHLDGPSYKLASVAIFVSDTVDGDYKYVKHFRPLGLESRDIGQFIDDDGSAYLIFESRPSYGFYIASLSDDYMDVAKQTCFINSPLEGGALVHYEGVYYVIGSHLSGWAPNPNVYATSKSLQGPWTTFKDIAPSSTKTYGSQSAFLLKVAGTQKTTVIFVGDMWRAKSLWDSRYMLMPLTIGDGQLSLPAPRPWTIDVNTGVVTFK